MRKIIIYLILFILCEHLLFSFYTSPDVFRLSENFNLNRTKSVVTECDVSKKSLLVGLFEKEKENYSAKESGTFLIYAGVAVAAVGICLLGVSFEDMPFVDTKKYRNPGIILTACGTGLMVVGFIIRKSASNKYHILELNIPPTASGAAFTYRISF